MDCRNRAERAMIENRTKYSRKQCGAGKIARPGGQSNRKRHPEPSVKMVGPKTEAVRRGLLFAYKRSILYTEQPGSYIRTGMC